MTTNDTTLKELCKILPTIFSRISPHTGCGSRNFHDFENSFQLIQPKQPLCFSENDMVNTNLQQVHQIFNGKTFQMINSMSKLTSSSFPDDTYGTGKSYERYTENNTSLCNKLNGKSMIFLLNLVMIKLTNFIF